MSQMVRCDVCGRISNKSYLNSHKRLAHGKHTPAATEPELVEAIVSIYLQLSRKGKETIRNRLASAGEQE